MKKLTPRQRAVLEFMRSDRPLCYGGEGHWFFHGGPMTVHGSTGFSLAHGGYVKERPRREGQPYWLHEYDLTAKGRAALEAA